MSFELRVSGVPREDGAPIWRLDGLEYELTELMKDKRFRLSVDSSLYADYVAIVNREEAIEIHNMYSLLPLMQKGHVAHSKFLDYLNQKAPITRWIIFEIYELD